MLRPLVVRLPLRCIELLREMVGDFLAQSVNLRFGEHLLADQAVPIKNRDRWLVLDPAIQVWLCVPGVVALVVTVTTIANHINDNILIELLAEFESESCYASGRLGIVSIHVENWRLNHAS